jgi:membrane associated rhomboid family serine protease
MSVVLALITVNVVTSLIGFRLLRTGDGDRARALLFIPHEVARGDNGRGMLLAHFTHAGFFHLILNMPPSTRFRAPCSTRWAPPGSC